MCFGKGKCSHLRPISFGLAAAVTLALAVFCMSAAIMMGYAPADMAARHPELVWSMVWTHALWALVKGFVFGFVFAFFYNLFACCIASCCQKFGIGGCGCGSDKKPE